MLNFEVTDSVSSMAISLSQNNVVMKKKQKKQGIEMVSTTKRFLPVTNAAQDKQWWIQTIIECSSPNETFLHFVPNRKEEDYLYLYTMLLCQRNLQWIQKIFSLKFLNTWWIHANAHGHKKGTTARIFFTEIHFMQGRIAITRNGVTRKKSSKRINHTGDLFRKNLQLRDVY